MPISCHASSGFSSLFAPFDIGALPATLPPVQAASLSVCWFPFLPLCFASLICAFAVIITAPPVSLGWPQAQAGQASLLCLSLRHERHFVPHEGERPSHPHCVLCPVALFLFAVAILSFSLMSCQPLAH